MKGKNFSEIIDLIVREDTRYDKNAYHFIRQALDYTLKSIQKTEKSGQSRHITGQELCDGIRSYALEQYGPMAFTLLSEWNIHSTQDFGELVFNLVEYEVFGKTDKDSRDDFKEVYSFTDVFKKPYEPKNKVQSRSKPNPISTDIPHPNR